MGRSFGGQPCAERGPFPAFNAETVHFCGRDCAPLAYRVFAVYLFCRVRRSQTPATENGEPVVRRVQIPEPKWREIIGTSVRDGGEPRQQKREIDNADAPLLPL